MDVGSKELTDFEVLSEFLATMELEQNQEASSQDQPTMNLQWDPAIDKKSRGPYFGNARTSKYYCNEKAQEKGKDSCKILEFFSVARETASVSTEDQQDPNGDLSTNEEPGDNDEVYIMTMQEAVVHLSSLIKPEMNQKRAATRDLDDYT